jgi:hypothetical protein
MNVYLCNEKPKKHNNMTTLEITYKPNSRIGNGMIAATSKMVADITPKENIWKEYGDQEIANMWANQILKHRFTEPCTLISANVTIK